MSVSRFNPTGFRPDLNMGLDRFDLAADQAGFVGLKIAPVFEVAFSAGEYKLREIADILQRRNDDRASDGTYQSAELRWGKGSFATEEHGFEVRIDRNQAAIHKNWWNADMEAAEAARDVVLRNHNARVIAAAQADRSQNTAAAAVWTNPSTANPIKDVIDARVAFVNRNGVRPNALAIDWSVYEYLLDNVAVRDRMLNLGLISEIRSPLLNPQVLAAAFDVQHLIISGAFTNSANQPNAATIASMWTKTSAALFLYDDNPNTLKPCFMRTLHWGEDGGNIGESIDRYYNEAKRSDVVRQRMQTQEIVLNGSLCQRITGVSA